MKLGFENRRLLRVTLFIVVALTGSTLVLISACEDDPLFAPAPPTYTWKPGTLHADSASYKDNDSITLYGHFKPMAFVIKVNSFSITLTEKQNGAIIGEIVHYLEQDKVWNFKPENYADTAVIAMLKIRRVVPRANTRYYFNLNLDIIPPPGYPVSAGRLQSTSVELNAEVGG